MIDDLNESIVKDIGEGSETVYRTTLCVILQACLSGSSREFITRFVLWQHQALAPHQRFASPPKPSESGRLTPRRPHPPRLSPPLVLYAHAPSSHARGHRSSLKLHLGEGVLRALPRPRLRVDQMGHELHALHQARAWASVVAVGIHGEHTPRLRRGQRLEPGPRQQVILHRSQMTVYTGAIR